MLGHAEPELEEPTEQTQAEEFTNLVWIKASPSAFNQCSCLLFLTFSLYSIMNVH
jgi:hypothetical protein